MRLTAPILAAAAIMISACSPADGEVIRHKIPNSDFPILLAVEVPPDATLVYLSGAGPAVVDETAEPRSPAAYGDITTQTDTTFQAIEARLEGLGLTMSDVIKLQVYIVAAPGEDSMDFSGFMAGYVKHFGTEAQPNLPTRSVFEVAGLANPGWLIEIEAVAVRQ
jgi:enamine deaminase RidA (YjgF/YER057c/UK114 family)